MKIKINIYKNIKIFLNQFINKNEKDFLKIRKMIEDGKDVKKIKDKLDLFTTKQIKELSEFYINEDHPLTIFQFTVCKSNYELVQYFIERKVNIDLKNKKERTALYYIFNKQNIKDNKILELLLLNGANLQFVDKYGCSALHLLLQRKNNTLKMRENINVLFDLDFKVIETTKPILTSFFSNNIYIENQYFNNIENVRKKEIEILKLLIKFKININQLNNKLKHPIFNYIEKNKDDLFSIYEILRILKKSGLDSELIVTNEFSLEKKKLKDKFKSDIIKKNNFNKRKIEQQRKQNNINGVLVNNNQTIKGNIKILNNFELKVFLAII